MLFSTSNDAWTQDQLNQRLATIAERPYQGAARALFPIDTEVASWADSYTASVQTQIPETAEIINYRSVLPVIGQFSSRSMSSPVIALGGAAEYTVQEVNVARQMGMDLSGAKLERAVSAIYRAEDRLVFEGSSNQSVYGLGNHPQIGHYPLAATGNSNGYTNTTLWAGKSIDQILREVADLRTAQMELAEQLNAPIADTLILPAMVVADLRSRLRGNEGSVTLWDILVSNLSGITILESSRMNSLPIASLGTNASCALFYNWAESLTVVIPQDTTIESPQQVDLVIKTPVHSRFGGLKLAHPESTTLIVGI